MQGLTTLFHGMTIPMCRSLFWAIARAGRSFGGIPPRRITHWLARNAYGYTNPVDSEYCWFRDCYGHEFLLHPHFLMDYEIIAFGGYERKTADFIRTRVEPGMTCLDVGANMGIMTLVMARQVAPGGLVHCFEPVPSVFQRLIATVERNRAKDVVRLYPLALSDGNGTATLAMTEGTDINQGMGSLVSREPKLSRSFQVQTLTLDSFAEREGLGRIDFIKLDIQGAEPLFLQGARQTLARWKPELIMEISPTELDTLGITPADLVREIEAIGYFVFNIRQGGRLGERLRSHELPSRYANPSVYCSARRPSI